jgi:hypothetical protein
MAGILEGPARAHPGRQQEIEDESRQGRLGFDPEEERQLAADRRFWVKRLQAIADELSAEPERIRRATS